MSALLGLLLALCSTVFISPGRAQAAGPPSVLFVLDSSGSMNAKDAKGIRLIDGAKDAVVKVASQLPSSSSVGLRVYGAAYGGKDRERSCRDTQLVLPVGKADPALIKAAVAGYAAVGDTPIGYALQQSRGDFPDDDSARVVVLVSDGEDNCSSPGSTPCDVARQMQQDDIELRIETVGLNVTKNAKARSELQCVARTTGGDYYDAKDTAALAATLNEIAARVVKDFSLGEPVQGGVSANEAPLLAAGVYRDTLFPGESKWYAFDVPAGRLPQAIAGVRAAAEPPPAPPADTRCKAWEARLLSRALEGGDYEPYYNAADFHGTATAATAVRSIGPADENTGGLDFPGRWYVRLSLAEATLETCSKNLPEEDYQVQLTFESLAPGEEGGAPQPEASESAVPVESPSSDELDEAVAKYFEEPDTGAPAWVYPVIAVLCLGLVGGGLVGYRLYRKSLYL